MPYTHTPLSPKTVVYRFGALWFWKCKKPFCAGGREHEWGKAVARANEHAASHAEKAKQ